VAETRRVRLDDHETCILDVGAGDEIVFAHAIGLDHEMWRSVVEALPRGRRIAYDLRCHGFAAGAPRPFTMERLADDLAALLDTLEIERVRLVGLSFGGGLALEFALAHPERVVDLTLVCSAWQGLPLYAERGDAMRRDGVEPAIPSTLERWFTQPSLDEDRPYVRYARERLRADGAEDFAAAWDALAALDVAARLGEIRAPTKVIAGELDVSTTPELLRRLADGIPGSTYHVVQGAPHMLSLERPDELAALIAA
jgi:3-oxoadipate enol-lactonase